MRFVSALAVFVLMALQAKGAAAQTLYYCDTWRAYYPGVLNCPVPWRAVDPATVAPRPGTIAAPPFATAQPTPQTSDTAQPRPTFPPRGDGLDELCKTATSPRTIALCSDTELRALAGERQHAFDDVRSKLTPDQQKALLADQNGWVKSYAQACGLAEDVPPSLPLAPAIKDCMARAGRARIAYLRGYGATETGTARTTPATAQTTPATLPEGDNVLELRRANGGDGAPMAPEVTAGAPTPLVQSFLSSGSNCTSPGCPRNVLYKCADPANFDEVQSCLGMISTNNGLWRPEELEVALGHPLYEKYMALKAEGIRLTREKRAKQVQEANSPHPAVAYTGIPWVAGALICQDVPTLTVLINSFQSYYEDNRRRTFYSEEQARIAYGAPISEPDPRHYGCVLVTQGTPLVRVRSEVLGYPFVRSVDPINGVEVEGITFPSMIKMDSNHD